MQPLKSAQPARIASHKAMDATKSWRDDSWKRVPNNCRRFAACPFQVCRSRPRVENPRLTTATAPRLDSPTLHAQTVR
ncbi:hypothetical protein RISK_005157 [Rhodopirellula islandica]|uniref:Uncharacterized protein n=1 Tax=Rhodopirellula islandica TaxID=595434 RepID=A0A0J1B8S1_RHOIS|nr:hypothetical protein RISK_005157 [Rhodopirellula islandica]